MNIKIQFLLSIISVLVLTLSSPTSSQAKEKDLTSRALRALQEQLTDIEYLEVDFIQNISSSLRGKSRRIEGKAYFAAPKKFRWIKQKPISEEIVYDGKTLVIHRIDDKTALKFNAATSQNKEIDKITDIVLDTKALLKSYKVKSAKLDDKTRLVSLVLLPKVESELQEISLEAELKKNFVRHATLKYEDNKVWSFTFSNPKNNKISDQRFKFVAPKDVKVNVVQP